MTCEEAAKLIEAEGRLGAGQLFAPNGDRCASAVIANAKPSWWDSTQLSAVRIKGIASGEIDRINDAFEGTPEERCTYMAAWFRSGGKA